MLVGFRDELKISEDSTTTFGDVLNGLVESLNELSGATEKAGETSTITWENFSTAVVGSVAEVVNALDHLVRVALVVDQALSAAVNLSFISSFEQYTKVITELRTEIDRIIDAPTTLERAATIAERRDPRNIALDTSDTDVFDTRDIDFGEDEGLREQLIFATELATEMANINKEVDALIPKVSRLGFDLEDVDIFDPSDIDSSGERLVQVQELALDRIQRIALTNTQSLAQDTERINAETSNDRVRLISLELEHALRAVDVRGYNERLSAADVEDYKEALRARTAAEIERERQDQLDREINERDRAIAERVEQVRLVFGADTADIEDAADVAAYSVGQFTNQLRNVHPAAGSAVSSIESVVTGVEAISAGGNRFAAAASIAGGIFTGITTIIGIFGQQAAEEDRRLQELNHTLRETVQRTSEFTRSLLEFSQSRIEPEFFRNYIILVNELGFDAVDRFVDVHRQVIDEVGLLAHIATQEISSAIRTELQIAVQEAKALEDQSQRLRTGAASNVSQAFDDYNHIVRLERLSGEDRLRIFRETVGEFLNLDDVAGADINLRTRRRIELEISDIQREIAEAEIAARREQADRLIEEIERQHREVLRVINDREEATRLAALRAVGAQFDLQEAALRASYLPQLRGAGGDTAASQLIIERVTDDIRNLRDDEAQAGTDALQQVGEFFENQRGQAEIIRDGLIDAVNASVEDLSVPFNEALTNNTFAFIASLDDSFSVFVASAANLGKQSLRVVNSSI